MANELKILFANVELFVISPLEQVYKAAAEKNRKTTLKLQNADNF